MGGQPNSKASSQSSAGVRRLWEEPTEVIPQNQRETVGILSLLGKGGCQLSLDSVCLRGGQSNRHVNKRKHDPLLLTKAHTRAG